MRLGAIRTVIVYIMLGSLWITLSDKFLFNLHSSLSTSTFLLLSGVKGFVFILVTSLVLWKLIKRDDERLTESEQQYRTMYEGNPSPMWIYDLETLRFVSVNDTAVSSYGYTKEEFLQMTILDIRPDYDTEKVRESVKNVSENVKQSGIWTHTKADGTQFFVSVSSQKIMFNNKPHVAVIAQDVNERITFEQRLKKLNNDLREKRSKLSETQQIAKVAGWELYLQNNYMLWSDEMHIITAIDPNQDDNMYDTYVQHIHPEDKAKVIKGLELLVNTGQQLDMAHRMILDNGSTHYVRQLARIEYLLDEPYKVVGSMQDITEFKMLELERNKYLFGLEDTLNTISESFFALNRNLIFIKVNVNFELETGFASSYVIGKHLLDVFPEIKNDTACSRFEQVLKDGVAVKFEEYSGTLRKWLSMSAYPTEEGLAVYFQDITVQKEKDIQLKLALERYDIVSKATNDVIYDYDMVDNHIVYNTSLSQLVNCDMERIDYNLNWWRSLIHPDDVLAVINGQEKVLAKKGSNWRCEYRIDCGDDHYKYVYDQGYFIYDEKQQPIRLLGAIKDIDALKKSDEENRRLAEIITKVNNMVVVMSTDGHITWVNKAFEDYTTYTFDEIIGRHSDDILSSLQISPELLTHINDRKSRRETFSIDVPHHLPKDGYQWLEIEYTPLFNDCKQYSGYIAVHQNITIRKEKEERINQQNKTLQEIAWLSSHEVRRPVASILGLVYLAQDTTSVQDKEEIMEMINSCAKELDDIVHIISEKVNEGVDLNA